MENVRVSVLMPVFRTPYEFFVDAVNSILQQTVQDFELLFLYEKSEDDEAVYVYMSQLSQADERVRIVETPKKFGLPKSLNLGLKEAKGEYIARMDSDDFSHLNRFAIQISYLETHPEVAVVGSAVRVMGSDRIIFGNYYTDRDIHNIRMLFSNAGVAHPTAFIRKSFLDEHSLLYNENIGGSEDYHLWADVLLCGGKIDIIDEPLLDYRIYAEQSSKILSDKMVAWDTDAKAKQLPLFELYNETNRELLEKWAREGLHADVKQFFDLFCAIINENKKRQVWDMKLLRKELSYQWMYKALLLLKNGKNAALLKPVYMCKLCPVHTWAYAFKNIQWVRKEWKGFSS